MVTEGKTLTEAAKALGIGRGSVQGAGRRRLTGLRSRAAKNRGRRFVPFFSAATSASGNLTSWRVDPPVPV